jgi:aryl-alcohol dehydrogenase-like predicted oxidoreductase
VSSTPAVRRAELVLGTMTFGAQVDAPTAAAMFARCLECGVTHVDTANAYTGGVSEEIVGQIIRGHRDELTLATKVGLPSPEDGDDAPLSATAIRRCAESSLRRLGTDHIDLYYLHQPDRSTPLDETLGAMAELVGEGKVGEIGVSNYAAWQIGDLLAHADASDRPRVGTSQIVHNLIARRIEDEYLEFADVHDVRTIAYNPLAGGLLSGKHDRERATGRFADPTLGDRYRERYWNDATFAAVSELGRLADAAGVTLVQFAYRWLIWQRGIDGVLIGASTPAQLEANLEAGTGDPLEADVLERCDAIWTALGGLVSRYNR